MGIANVIGELLAVDGVNRLEQFTVSAMKRDGKTVEDEAQHEQSQASKEGESGAAQW